LDSLAVNTALVINQITICFIHNIFNMFIPREIRCHGDVLVLCRVNNIAYVSLMVYRISFLG